MRLKFIVLAATMTVLAACSKPADTTGGVAGDAGISGGVVAPTGDAGALASQLHTIDRIFFAFDKSDISPEARGILERQASLFQANPSVTFTVEGHCDERGTREYNLALGERRATSDKNGMVALGVSASRGAAVPSSSPMKVM